MRFVEKNGIEVLKFPELEKFSEIEHCITTRIGGVSKGPYASLNMGLTYIEDQKKDSIENFDRVARTFFDKTAKDYVRTDQVHDNKIRIIREEDRGKGLLRERDYNGIDGLITDAKGIILATGYADCTPLLIYDPIKKVIGSIHSGWKGTLKGIGKEAIETMVNEFNCKLEDILVGIGPTIGPESFEVELDVYSQFENRYDDIERILYKRAGKKYYLNLWEANRIVLEEAGIDSNNIFIDDHCTFTNEDKFFSHRRDRGKTGRMAALIMLK
ncbi:MAG: peptidoglycan editing factor PgeF [Andreesenia angusta]|nr:peptidoglycan editing factor PgeF [Andreesenia angusta]